MRSFGLTATPSTYGPPLTRVYYLWTGARRTGGENLARLTQVYTKRVDRDRVSLRAASPLPIPTVKVLPPPVLRQPRAARPGFRYSFVWAAVFLLLLEQRLLRRPSWGILVALRERGRYPYMGPWAQLVSTDRGAYPQNQFCREDEAVGKSPICEPGVRVVVNKNQLC